MRQLIESLQFSQFDTLMDMYPQTMVGTAVGVGFAALLAISHEDMTVQQFHQTSLQDKQLEHVTARAARLYSEYGAEPPEAGELAETMSQFYDLTKASFLSSVLELSKVDKGRKLEQANQASDEDVAAISDFLEDRTNMANALNLLGNCNTVLKNGAAKALAGQYRLALYGKPALGFDPMMSASSKKANLAAKVHVLLYDSSVSTYIVRRGGLTENQIEVFAHNITRP